MRRISLFLLSIAAFAAPPGRLANGVTVSNGVTIQYETQLEPGSPPIERHGGGVLTENEVIKRHLCNFDNNTYFGYDLTIKPTADGRYKLQFAPLSMTAPVMKKIFPQTARWAPLARPDGLASLVVKAGETVALDLFVNPSTGQKVTEYLIIKRDK